MYIDKETSWDSTPFLIEVYLEKKIPIINQLKLIKGLLNFNKEKNPTGWLYKREIIERSFYDNELSISKKAKGYDDNVSNVHNYLQDFVDSNIIEKRKVPRIDNRGRKQKNGKVEYRIKPTLFSIDFLLKFFSVYEKAFLQELKLNRILINNRKKKKRSNNYLFSSKVPIIYLPNIWITPWFELVKKNIPNSKIINYIKRIKIFEIDSLNDRINEIKEKYDTILEPIKIKKDEEIARKVEATRS